MKKYTSKSQKVEIYSKQYGLSEEEIFRILTEHEDLLTFEELKIRYNNPEMGKLPEWLTEEDLWNIIWNSIHECWSPLFEQRMTKEELFTELYEYIKKKMNRYENFKHLKCAIINQIRSLAFEYTRRGKYFIGSTDETYPENDDSGVRYKFEGRVYDDVKTESQIFINNIRSLTDQNVKNLLIIAGYLLADIPELRIDYIELLRKSESEVKENIKTLAGILDENDQLEWDRMEKVKREGKKKKIKIQDIIKALELHKPFTKESDKSENSAIARCLKSLYKDIGKSNLFEAKNTKIFFNNAF